MWKSILYFLLINLGYFALVVTIYALGYEYDKANHLYPESVQVSYDVSLGGVIGQRWVRFAQTAIAIGIAIDLILGVLWYRKRIAKAHGHFLSGLVA